MFFKKRPHRGLAHLRLTELIAGFVRNKMVPVLLLASLIWSVTQSHDHHVTQDTTPAVGNVSIMTYSGGRRKGLSHAHDSLTVIVLKSFKKYL
jgi:hypothetical protein